LLLCGGVKFRMSYIEGHAEELLWVHKSITNAKVEGYNRPFSHNNIPYVYTTVGGIYNNLQVPVWVRTFQVADKMYPFNISYIHFE